jgi:hypothetical protein
MIASTVACTLARLAACERDLRACEPISPSGCWAAALRYIRLARQMLEAAEVSTVQTGPDLPGGNVAQASPDRLDLSAQPSCRSGLDCSREPLGLVQGSSRSSSLASVRP